MEKNNLYYYGPKVWLLIHKYALQNNKSPISKIYFSKMISDILQLFPCIICQKHFADVLKKYPLVNEQNIFFWSFKIHNEVNIAQKKITSPCLSSCEKLYASISRNELIKTLFDVTFTFVSTDVSGEIIKKFLKNIAELNEDEIKKNILYLISIHYNSNISTFNWVFKIYNEMCNRFNINDRLDRQTCLSFFEIKTF